MPAQSKSGAAIRVPENPFIQAMIFGSDPVEASAMFDAL
jgi:hypothetical protein